jgi:glutamine synthetase
MSVSSTAPGPYLPPKTTSNGQGGTHICWGIENREAPVRACPYGDGREYNFEIKCIDGTANPYLAVAAILAAGMIGVKDSYPLAMKPCQGTPPRCGG